MGVRASHSSSPGKEKGPPVGRRGGCGNIRMRSAFGFVKCEDCIAATRSGMSIYIWLCCASIRSGGRREASACEGIKGSRGEGMDMLFGVFARLGVEFVHTGACSKRASRSK